MNSRTPVLMAILMLSAAIPAWAQMSLDPIDNYLTSAEQKANNVVTNAGAQGRGVAMEAGQSVLNAIASFRAAYADSLKLSEKTLTGQRAALFKDIRASVDVLSDYTKETTSSLQKITDTLALGITNIPFSKDIPRVTRIAPLYEVEASNSKELVVTGLSIATGSPMLEIAGKTVKPNTATDTELRFPLPTEKSVGNKPVFISTTLHLFERIPHTFWFDSYKPHDYPVRIAVYPRAIGQITVTPRRETTVVNTQNQTSGGYRCESDHGEGSKTTPVSISASPGWSIDPKTIAWNKGYENHGTMTFNSTGPGGFTATLSCYGYGIQKGPFGVVVDAGSQGVISGSFAWTEAKQDTTLVDGSPTVQVIGWGDAITISTLPPDTKTVVASLRAFSGDSLSLEGSGSNRFVTLTFNDSSKIATLTAHGIDDVLRQ